MNEDQNSRPSVHKIMGKPIAPKHCVKFIPFVDRFWSLHDFA